MKNVEHPMFWQRFAVLGEAWCNLLVLYRKFRQNSEEKKNKDYLKISYDAGEKNTSARAKILAGKNEFIDWNNLI